MLHSDAEKINKNLIYLLMEHKNFVCIYIPYYYRYIITRVKYLLIHTDNYSGLETYLKLSDTNYITLI